MYYVAGQYVKEEDAKISVLDLSILRGFGIFDYLRTYQGKPFHLTDHLLRLQYSAEHVGLTLPNSLQEIEEIVHKVKSHLTEASIKILVTGGASPDQFTPHPQNTLIVFAYPLQPYPHHYYLDGVHVITTPLSRSLPTAKTTQYTPAIVALRKAHAQEALYLNAQQEILEGTTSNFFAFKKGILHTNCSSEVLHGITQEIILRLAEPHYPIQFTPLHLNEIPELEEAFLTASNKEVMPVTHINQIPIANGSVGPKTQHLMSLFRTYTQSEFWPSLAIPRYGSFFERNSVDNHCPILIT